MAAAMVYCLENLMDACLADLLAQMLVPMLAPLLVVLKETVLVPMLDPLLVRMLVSDLAIHLAHSSVDLVAWLVPGYIPKKKRH